MRIEKPSRANSRWLESCCFLLLRREADQSDVEPFPVRIHEVADRGLGGLSSRPHSGLPLDPRDPITVALDHFDIIFHVPLFRVEIKRCIL